jgi:hypothetical protein
MLEAGVFQPREAFQPVGVDRAAWRYIVFEKGEQSLSSEVGDHRHGRKYIGIAFVGSSLSVLVTPL